MGVALVTTSASSSSRRPAGSPPGPAASGRLLWSRAGSGTLYGPNFTVPARAHGWDVEWTYDCSSVGTVGEFGTTILGYGPAAPTGDVGTDQFGTKGSGTSRYHDTGTFSIVADSPCRWTVRAFIP